MRDDGRAVLAADVEHQAVAGDAEMQGVRPAAGPFGREHVGFDQIVNRNRALVLDVRPGTADRLLIERHRDDAIVGVILWCRVGHDRLRRIPTDRA